MMGWYYTFEAKEIQGFILQSDKLRDMVGGSELVAQLCGRFLEKALLAVGVQEPQSVIIASAAGWARIRFEEETRAREFSRYWPLIVSRYAPGLRLIQTLLPIDRYLPDVMQKGMDELRAERNRNYPLLPDIGPLVERSPRTGMAASSAPFDKKADKTVPLDLQTMRKRKYAENQSSLTKRILPAQPHDVWPYEIEEIASDKSAYVAVIHADGNDLGSTLMRIREHLRCNPDTAAAVYRELSEKIEQITVSAVTEATEAVLMPDYLTRRQKNPDAKIAARPIVLGGDDLTIIVRADLALEFTATFLDSFERNSRQQLAGLCKSIKGFPEMLTACAGIALVKKAYPFTAAYQMAETLCDYTKKQAKLDRDARRQQNEHLPVPSSFTYHRITTSMAEGYAEVQRKELTGRGQYEGLPIRFWYGPYAVGTQTGKLPLLQTLQQLSKAIRNLPGGSVRTLISTMHTDPVTARKDFERICEVAKKEAATELYQTLQQLTGTDQNPLWNKDNHTPLADAYLLAELEKGADHA
jgi:hypothetical protein